MQSKGQVSLEFMMISVMLLTMMSIFIAYFYTVIADTSIYQEDVNLRYEAETIANEINKAYLGGHGYMAYFFLTPQNPSRPFTITVDDSAGYITVDAVDAYGIAPILSRNVQIIEWRYGEYQIAENNNGVVIIR